MAIRPQDIGFVLQGPVGDDSPSTPSLAETIRRLRQLSPGSEIILSTWDNALSVADYGADRVVLSPDPGPLPSIKKRGASVSNNANRQIVSTKNGLAAISRPYAVKMRTDTYLLRTNFIELFEKYPSKSSSGRILTGSFFTIDPRAFEHVPYHFSDWFQFGATKDLTEYWSAPLMSAADATYYQRHRYAPSSSFLDRTFQCRLAVEQHIAVAYAQRLGMTVPAYHNDIRAEVLEDHDRFVKERLIIADCEEIGLVFPKYAWAYQSRFHRFNCISFVDWLDLSGSDHDGSHSGEIRSRRRAKASAKALYAVGRAVLPVIKYLPPNLKASLRSLAKF